MEARKRVKRKVPFSGGPLSQQSPLPTNSASTNTLSLQVGDEQLHTQTESAQSSKGIAANPPINPTASSPSSSLSVTDKPTQNVIGKPSFQMGELEEMWYRMQAGKTKQKEKRKSSNHDNEHTHMDKMSNNSATAKSSATVALVHEAHGDKTQPPSLDAASLTEADMDMPTLEMDPDLASFRTLSAMRSAHAPSSGVSSAYNIENSNSQKCRKGSENLLSARVVYGEENGDKSKYADSNPRKRKGNSKPLQLKAARNVSTGSRWKSLLPSRSTLTSAAASAPVLSRILPLSALFAPTGSSCAALPAMLAAPFLSFHRSYGNYRATLWAFVKLYRRQLNSQQLLHAYQPWYSTMFADGFNNTYPLEKFAAEAATSFASSSSSVSTATDLGSLAFRPTTHVNSAASTTASHTSTELLPALKHSLPSSVSSHLLYELLAREYGLLSANALEQRLLQRELLNMDLAPSDEVISNHNSEIRVMDLERAEQRFLLAGSANGKISVHDTQVKLEEKGFQAIPVAADKWESGHQAAITGLEWYPFDSGMFISSSVDGNIHLWDANQYRIADTFGVGSVIHAATISPSARCSTLIATASASHHVRICDILSGSFTHSLLGHTAAVTAVAWHPTMDYLLSSASEDAAIRLWDIRRAGCLAVLDENNYSASSFALTSSSAAASSSNSLFTHSYLPASSHSAAIRSLRSHHGVINYLIFSHDGTRLYSAGADQQIRMWDTQTYSRIFIQLPQLKTRNIPSRFVLSNDDSLIIIPCGQAILLCETENGRCVKELTGHFGQVTCAILKQSADLLLTAGDDSFVLVWRPRTAHGSEVADYAQTADTSSSISNGILLTDHDNEVHGLGAAHGGRRRVGQQRTRRRRQLQLAVQHQ